MSYPAQPQRLTIRKPFSVAGAFFVLFMPLLTILVLHTPAASQTYTYTVLHSFAGGSDGAYPHAGLIGAPRTRDARGNIYGTTSAGGASGNGTVFVIHKYGAYEVLNSFAGQPDGQDPEAGLVRAFDGTLYGTTYSGGVYGFGTVYRIDKTGTETVLHSFTGAEDGKHPLASLSQDTLGNLYGTTYAGGTFDLGVVFKMDTSGNETVLHSFSGAPDGANPMAATLPNSYTGVLYGTTWNGGAYDQGAIFQVDASGVESVMYSFSSGLDGAHPIASLISKAGTFPPQASVCGTTDVGGTSGAGTLFNLNPTTGKGEVWHNFKPLIDGTHATALVSDTNGTLYGMTQSGGAFGQGSIFKIDSAGVETVLYSFSGGDDGASPVGNLLLIRAHGTRLYGTTAQGGTNGMGTVFSLSW